MNMEPNISNPGSPPPVPALPNESQTRIATRPLYWSVLRELWENKSIYIAPAIVAAVLLVGALVSSGYLPERRRNAMLLDEVRRRAAIELPYNIVAMMLIVTAFIIGFFYCLDALYGERRDRSISVLEIVASLGPHNRSFEGDHPARDFAGDYFRGRRRHAILHAAYQQRGADAKRSRGNDLGKLQPAPAIGGVVLRPDRHRALARADLRMGSC